MSQAKHSITNIQAIFIMLLSAGMFNHVILIPMLIQTSGRDGWLSIIMALFLCLLWLPIVYWIMKKKGNTPLFPWMKQAAGSAIAWIVTLVIYCYLLSIAYVTLYDTSMWTNATYLPRTPFFIVALTLVVLCMLCALAGLRSIAICSGILLPFVVIFGYFVMSANFQYKDYTLLRPVLEHGIVPAIHGTLYVGGGFIELLMLAFMQHHFSSKRMGFVTIAILAVMLAGLTIGPYLGSIAAFGPIESARQRYPAFEQWRLVMVGKYIEHVDFLSIYQWLSGSFIRISLAIFLACDLMPLRKPRLKKAFCLITALLVFSLAMLQISDIDFQRLLLRIYFPVVIPVMVAVSIILWVVALLNHRKWGNAQ
ncbi:endospore germination permease [Paenibacillus sp. MSJ-34]|uniref:GerAB/ArcD/ProY family transporter n=1 Tax=Paenibacillus sp. MSJ-34 TaxID=2841529 RepID=UPI001C101481|nr:endospore germination permease [Paenibacillus sp. MSJ-34]MBU5445032.1 endospore germination permease [Paenibacillus sp. MSJ-34]